MRGNRGGRRGRGRGRGRGGRGRGKKSAKVIESDDDEMPMQSGEEANDENYENQQPSNKSGDWREQTQQLDIEADISLLEAPTFTTLNRCPPEIMLRFRWDHPVNLMGEKVLNPMIHCCDKCSKPILIYGRMIPCKHVFCLSCVKQEDKICPRCQDNVTRVEQAGLGTVFMCVHGGTRYGNAGCRRTYLSQRDLQAHINHRHSVQTSDSTSNQFSLNKETSSSQALINKIGVQSSSSHPPPISSHSHQTHHGSHVGSSQQRMKHVSNTTDPRIQVDVSHHRSSRGPSPPPPPPPPYAPIQHRPPMMVAPAYTTTAPPLRTNLITVPIQDVNASMSSLDMTTGSYHHHYTQPPPPTQYTHSPYGVPPPQTGQYYSTVSYSNAQPQYVQQVVPQGGPQGVPQVAQGMPTSSQGVQGVPQVPQAMGQAVGQGVPQGVPPPQTMSTALRPPQYQDNQYRAPPPSHPPQWQHPTNNPPPFYR